MRMYIAIIAPSNPHSDVPVVPSHRFPARSQSRRSTISHLPSPRGTGSLAVSLHLPSLQPCTPSLSRCPSCAGGPAVDHDPQGLYITSLLSPSQPNNLTSPLCSSESLSVFHYQRQLSVNLFFFLIVTVYAHWGISMHCNSLCQNKKC